MNLHKYLLLGAAALALGACSDDDGPTGTRGPLAYVRFVHAVPDTMRVNAIFVNDPFENLPSWYSLGFRSASGLYQGVEAGERAIRVFPDSPIPAYATQRLIDTTVTLAEGQYYTLVYSGNARGNNDYLAVIEDDIPTPGAGTIALRALNANPALAAVDVYVADSSKAPLTAPDETFTGVAYREASAYAALPVLTAAGPELYEYAVTAEGSGTAVATATPNQKGIAATSTGVSAQAGVQISGSVLTAVHVPGAVAGSPAATTSNLTPTIIYLLDNVPGT
jgi:hypothetical protein